MTLWNKIKNVGNSIKRGVKQGARWAWNNREGIAKGISTVANVAGYFGVPYADKVTDVAHKFIDINKKATKAYNDSGLKGILKTQREAQAKGESDEPNVKINIKPKLKSVESKSSSTQSSPGGYSVNPRANGGTPESRRYNYESFR